MRELDARFRNPPIGGFKHVECIELYDVVPLAPKVLYIHGRMPLWNALDCFITENFVLPVMYDSVHSVLVKQHGYIQWTNCTKNTLLGNQINFFKSVKLAILQF